MHKADGTRETLRIMKPSKPSKTTEITTAFLNTFDRVATPTNLRLGVTIAAATSLHASSPFWSSSGENPGNAEGLTVVSDTPTHGDLIASEDTTQPFDHFPFSSSAVGDTMAGSTANIDDHISLWDQTLHDGNFHHNGDAASATSAHDTFVPIWVTPIRTLTTFSSAGEAGDQAESTDPVVEGDQTIYISFRLEFSRSFP